MRPARTPGLNESQMNRSSPQSHRREPPPNGFDFTGNIRRVCDDMIGRLDQLRHVDMSRVAVSYSQTRRSGKQGMFAALTPLRFAGGRMHTFRRKRRWGIQRLFDPDGREMLYILTFYLPRFLDLPQREKLTTVLHELWHVGPAFDRRRPSAGRPLLRPRFVAEAVRRSHRGPVGPLAFARPAAGALRLPSAHVPRAGRPAWPRLWPEGADAQAGAAGLTWWGRHSCLPRKAQHTRQTRMSAPPACGNTQR